MTSNVAIVPTPDASAPSTAAAASKISEAKESEEKAAHLACPGVPMLATLKELDEEDKTIVDEMIDDDWKHRNDAGYCGYAHIARASARGIDYFVWVIKRGFYVGALDVSLIVQKQTLDDSLRIIQALHERRFEFSMDLPLVCVEKKYYPNVEWLFLNVEQFRDTDKVLAFAIEKKDVQVTKELCWFVINAVES